MNTPKKTLIELGGSWTPVTFDAGIRLRRANLWEYDATTLQRGFSAERQPNKSVTTLGTLPAETVGHFAEWLIGHYDNLG